VVAAANDGWDLDCEEPLADCTGLVVHRCIRKGILEITGDDKKVEEWRLRCNPVEPIVLEVQVRYVEDFHS
jgi:hypothetical protein